MFEKLHIQVPATSANLGVGFDCLGLALDLFADIYISPSDKLLITGCEERFQGRDNLIWTSYLNTCMRLSVAPCKALHIHIDSPIPLSGGLGSSSCCVVAGVLAAQYIHADDICTIDIQDTFHLACAIEGHPDNVAPAIFGGLVASFFDGENFCPLSFPISEKLHFVVMAPPYEVRTQDARRVMPDTVSLDTCVWQVGHAIALLRGLECADTKLIRSAAQDRLHEPHRQALIKDFEPLQRTCLAAGASSFLISGSGSSMLAICGDSQVAQNVSDAVLGMVENKVEGLKLFTLGLAKGAKAEFLEDSAN